MTQIPEPINWNEVKTLLEKLEKDIGLVAEGVVDVNRKMTAMASQLKTVAEDVAIVKPAVQKNTKDIDEIRKDVREIKNRLSLAEAKLPA